MKNIQIEVTRSQFDQLADLIIKTRPIIRVHQTGQVSVPTDVNKISIEWTPRAVEITIPD